VNPYYSSDGSRQVFRLIKFEDKEFEESWMCDIPCFRGSSEEEGVKKFEVNQTNLERVILPTVSSSSSDDLRSDVR
jgi:hypothetical protein